MRESKKITHKHVSLDVIEETTENKEKHSPRSPGFKFEGERTTTVVKQEKVKCSCCCIS